MIYFKSYLLFMFLILLLAILIYKLNKVYHQSFYYKKQFDDCYQSFIHAQDEYRKLEVKYLNIKDDYERVCIQLKQKS